MQQTCCTVATAIKFLYKVAFPKHSPLRLPAEQVEDKAGFGELPPPCKIRPRAGQSQEERAARQPGEGSRGRNERHTLEKALNQKGY